jgi:sugar phosphate isomerase/epimerase
MSRFLLSCTTCSTRMPFKDEILECFQHGPKAGYKAWGVAGPVFWTPGVASWVNYDLINARAAEAGFETCTEVYGPTFPTTSASDARLAANYLALLFDAAEKLNSPLVVFTGGRRVSGGIDATIEGIKALLPLIEHKPIRLALEPHFSSQIMYTDDYDAIFAEIDSPQVGITLDSGHLHSAGVDWRGLIRKYPDRIYNFHVKDHVGTQSVPLGEGEIDLLAYIQELHAIGYEGALAVELEVKDPENLPRYCADAFVYLRGLVKDVTGQYPD